MTLIIPTAFPGRAHAAVSTAEAKEIYHDYCSVCHGDRGDGRSRARGGLTPPPRDFTAPGMLREIPRERMIHSILEGRPGTAMVGWKSRLTQAQAEALADYIITAFMQPAAPEQATVGATADGRASMNTANLPKGNPQRGQTLYMANCATCHGTRGQGDGPRAYFINPPPRDFTSAQARAKLDRRTLFVAVTEGVQGKEMPAWGRVLTRQQIADVSAFVSRQFLGVTAKR